MGGPACLRVSWVKPNMPEKLKKNRKRHDMSKQNFNLRGPNLRGKESKIPHHIGKENTH